jgi:hypothetical protein
MLNTQRENRIKKEFNGKIILGDITEDIVNFLENVEF